VYFFLVSETKHQVAHYAFSIRDPEMLGEPTENDRWLPQMYLSDAPLSVSAWQNVHAIR
jgi:hypothetical protein